MTSLTTAIKNGNTVQIPTWTIQSGLETKLHETIVIHPSGRVWAQAPAQGVLDFSQISKITLFIDTLARAPTTYARIVDHPIWRELYQTTQRKILYADGTHIEDTMPCQYCGIILPPRLLQIDHQRPQNGGQLEAVVKTMRVMGLTVAGPHGEKCTQLEPRIREAMHAEDDSASVAVLMTEPDRQVKGFKVPRIRAVTPRGMRGAAPGASSTGSRYSLSDEGKVFFSVVKYFQLVERLERQAMNSVTNLRPLCGPCNGSRGNGDLKVNKI
ncbi:hypothetical protein BCR34DRAFT_608688 [Clohesyomyces aquaticus]|uniref:Uncharacterized protein n=1 Tax=Clohesyomyces aquaticus TaxID=1231657 RepID=A0A1Y1Y4I0_9PLEO|nr:hypothetical protein BCR34DRAFT_608688 [Clohesyomyces aquaticus]